MKKLLLLSTLIVHSTQILIADVYPINLQPADSYEHIVLLSDWDAVIADDYWTITQVLNAFSAIPSQEWWPLIRDSTVRGLVIKKIWDAWHNSLRTKGVAANLNEIIKAKKSLEPHRAAIMESVSDARPRYAIIEFYQRLGIPIILATNNDYETIVIKIAKLNAHLSKKKLPQFKYDAYYLGGSNPQLASNKAPDGLPAGFVLEGKDSDVYFQQIFKFVETELGYPINKTLFIFIDDNKKNVDRAGRVAQKEGVALLNVWRNKSDSVIVREVETALKKHASNFFSAMNATIVK